VAKKKTIKSAPTPDQYLDFIGAMVLQGVGLDNAKVNIDRGELAQATLDDAVSQLSLDTEFGVILNTNEQLIVGAKLKINQSKKNDLSNQLLNIECSFSALFQLGFPGNSVFANRFANTEAKLIFWPYFRHFIADTSYRMAITPILVPLITAAGQQEKNLLHKKKASKS